MWHLRVLWSVEKRELMEKHSQNKGRRWTKVHLLNTKRNYDGCCFYLQYVVEACRKRVKGSRLDLPRWKCGQSIWMKCPPGIFCESLLAATHLSREWLQGNAWLTTADVSSTTSLFWDERLRCFWIRLQSFQKFSLLKGQQRHRTGLKRALNISGFLERKNLWEKESVSLYWNKPSIWYQDSDIRHLFHLFK